MPDTRFLRRTDYRVVQISLPSLQGQPPSFLESSFMSYDSLLSDKGFSEKIYNTNLHILKCI